MRKALVFFVLVLAGAWASPALANCPGTSGCKISKCPKKSKKVNPGQSIQQAINAAPCTPSSICVLPGTYTELIDFKGKPINLVAQGAGATLSGALSSGNTGPVVTFKSGEGKNSILDGFTIRDGRANIGAGILIDQASPTIRNAVLTENTAVDVGSSYGRGGGIAARGAHAHPTITCTKFLKNSAEYGGGGLLSAYSATPYLRSNLFEENNAPYGGAIAVHWSGRLDLGWTQLLANEATVDGGGIHAGTPYGNVLVRQAWFKGNKAGSSGGGMWVSAGLADVINSTFDGNQAAEGGGIAAGFGSMVNVASNLFVSNTNGSLVNTGGSNTSVVIHYNGFFPATGGDFLGTYGDKGLLVGSDPLLGGSCCPGPGSPTINAGIPDYHFDDADGTTNDMGACGGPALATYGPMK